MNREVFRHYAKRFLAGVMMGVGGMLPGVSGSVLAVAFGLYGPILEAVATFFRNVKENLKRDEKKQQTMLNKLKSKEKDLNKQLKQQQKKVAELNKKIDNIVRKQSEQASKSTMTKEQKLLAGGFEANKGRLPWPVEKGMISSHYGKQQHPLYEHVITENKGVNIQTTAGTKARTVYAGEVTSCFMVANTYAVIIQHGNYRTVYSNLSKLNVKQGDKVETKQTIGTIYTDPEQDQKTELYFQIYKDKDILNPELWIAK